MSEFERERERGIDKSERVRCVCRGRRVRRYGINRVNEDGRGRRRETEGNQRM